MGNQRDLAITGGYRGHGVTNMNHERAAANSGAVEKCWNDAEVIGDSNRRLAGAENAVNLLFLNPCVRKSIAGGLGVQLNGRFIRNLADGICFRRADDCNLLAKIHC